MDTNFTDRKYEWEENYRETFIRIHAMPEKGPIVVIYHNLQGPHHSNVHSSSEDPWIAFQSIMMLGM